ncbi:bacillithiol system redox-active protein YtxJ [Flagellimonas allohymeniacidonis]|uniref:Bacillithiol system redox-active protein YtxJ n=1 Tax=Flagellimonas allohymeniacidonis TaxID=2517819 RepID=A0A4Q8QJV9_9FLAO|nr:bacillithiol system redox-active protein YtxJ [Allomuricauda hymeniacidonis]TAI49043.1 bacillithiol system redox-active protein YtxJ [Allomuricauda hymeniacidonis]
MGLFDSVFGKRDETNKEVQKVPWIPLTSLDQLDEIVQESDSRPQLIFKHSTTCGISRMVLNMFTGTYNLGDDVDIYFLDLHQYRDVSNAVESQLGLIHESPQLLVIKNGEISFHASHGAIADIDLKEYV